MKVLMQMGTHQIPSSPSACRKSIYASEKVRDVIKDADEQTATAIQTVKQQEDVTMVTTPPKHKAKVVVLGDSGVGKTSIIYRHKYGPNYQPVNATIGASFVPFDVLPEQHAECRLQVWDTAGQERFRCMVPMYMRNADAALVVYDITNRSSFESVERWIRDLGRTTGTDDVNIYLIGNKTDLADRRCVSEAEGKALAVKMNAKFFEVTSSQDNVFSEILSQLAEDVLSHRSMKDQSVSDQKLKIVLDESFEDSKISLKSKKSKCCSVL